MRRQEDPQHEARNASIANAVVFFAFVFVGCAFIMLAKSAGLAQWQVTVVPVAIMFAYAAMVMIFRGLWLRDDQAGDNLYYMGFLFTLTSLGMALIQFDSEQGGAEIVRNFGIAIASTIAGVALRVGFNQMRRDPIDVERVSRLELADAARRVRRELDATVAEMNFFRRTTQQSISESLEEVRKSVQDTTEKLVASLNEMTVRSAGPLDEAAKGTGARLDIVSHQLNASLSKTVDAFVAESDRLANSAQTLSTEINTIASRLAAMRTPDEVIEVSVKPISHALNGAIGRLVHSATKSNERFEQVAMGLSESMKNIGHAIEQNTAATRADQISAPETIKALIEIAGRLERLTALLEKDHNTPDQPAPVISTRGWRT